jgi:uncharacterized cupredoxin-like copper-binding protein
LRSVKDSRLGRPGVPGAGTGRLADVRTPVRRVGIPRSAPARRRARTTAVALARAIALAAGLAACEVGEVPATPPITPGIAGAPRQVNVILKDYLFEPPVLDLVPGETVRLNVVNGGLDTHELIIGTQAVQDAWAAAEAPAADPPPGPTPLVAVAPGLEGIRLVVPSGETRSITWTVPANAGALLLGCHISDHYARGMAGLVRAVGPGGILRATPRPSSSAWPTAP